MSEQGHVVLITGGSRALGKGVGKGVRVNCVRLGVIDTDIHDSGGQPDRAEQKAGSIPLGRPGQASEVAAAIVWLLSDEASYATGAILNVGGGR